MINLIYVTNMWPIESKMFLLNQQTSNFKIKIKSLLQNLSPMRYVDFFIIIWLYHPPIYITKPHWLICYNLKYSLEVLTSISCTTLTTIHLFIGCFIHSIQQESCDIIWSISSSFPSIVKEYTPSNNIPFSRPIYISLSLLVAFTITIITPCIHQYFFHGIITKHYYTIFLVIFKYSFQYQLFTHNQYPQPLVIIIITTIHKYYFINLTTKTNLNILK